MKKIKNNENYILYKSKTCMINVRPRRDVDS